MNEQALTTQITPQAGTGPVQGSVEAQTVDFPNRLASGEKGAQGVSSLLPISSGQHVLPQPESPARKGSIEIFALSLHGTEKPESSVYFVAPKESKELHPEEGQHISVPEVRKKLEEAENTVVPHATSDVVAASEVSMDKADNEGEKKTGFITTITAEVNGAAMTDLLKELEKKRYALHAGNESAFSDAGKSSGINVIFIKKFFLDRGREINILDIIDELLGNKKKEKKERLSLWAFLKDMFAFSKPLKKAENQPDEVIQFA